MTPKVEALVGRLREKAEQCDRLAEVSRVPACFEYRAKAVAYREAVTCILAALSASAQEPGWRTMESAPRDCVTEIDMWCESAGGDGEGWCVRGVLMIGEPDWIRREDSSDYWPHENGGFLTHWRPTPTTPSANAGGDA